MLGSDPRLTCRIMDFKGRAKDSGSPGDVLTGASFLLQNVGKKIKQNTILDRIWDSTAQHGASKALADGLGILRSQSQETMH